MCISIANASRTTLQLLLPSVFPSNVLSLHARDCSHPVSSRAHLRRYPAHFPFIDKSTVVRYCRLGCRLPFAFTKRFSLPLYLEVASHSWDALLATRAYVLSAFVNWLSAVILWQVKWNVKNKCIKQIGIANARRNKIKCKMQFNLPTKNINKYFFFIQN